MLAIRHLTIRALTVAVVLFVACTSSEIKPPFPTATDVAATATPEAIQEPTATSAVVRTPRPTPAPTETASAGLDRSNYFELVCDRSDAASTAAFDALIVAAGAASSES